MKINKKKCTKMGHLCKNLEMYKAGVTVCCDMCSRNYLDLYEKKDSKFPKCSYCEKNDMVGLEYDTKDKYFCLRCGKYVKE